MKHRRRILPMPMSYNEAREILKQFIASQTFTPQYGIYSGCFPHYVPEPSRKDVLEQKATMDEADIEKELDLFDNWMLHNQGRYFLFNKETKTWSEYPVYRFGNLLGSDVDHVSIFEEDGIVNVVHRRASRFNTTIKRDAYQLVREEPDGSLTFKLGYCDAVYGKGEDPNGM